MVDKNAHYLMCKDWVYYFTRHFLNDLKEQYNTLRIVTCLKTRNKNSALKSSRLMAGKLDDLWLQLRVANMNIPAADKFTDQQPSKPSKSYALKLSDAVERYCRLKGVDKK